MLVKMSQAVILRLVYPSEVGIPWTEYLAQNETLEDWYWSKFIQEAHVFAEDAHYERKLLELKASGEEHAYPMIYGTDVKARIDLITPEKCYQMTLRRMGEKD